MFIVEVKQQCNNNNNYIYRNSDEMNKIAKTLFGDMLFVKLQVSFVSGVRLWDRHTVFDLML